MQEAGSASTVLDSPSLRLKPNRLFSGPRKFFTNEILTNGSRPGRVRKWRDGVLHILHSYSYTSTCFRLFTELRELCRCVTSWSSSHSSMSLFRFMKLMDLSQSQQLRHQPCGWGTLLLYGREDHQWCHLHEYRRVQLQEGEDHQEWWLRTERGHLHKDSKAGLLQHS